MPRLTAQWLWVSSIGKKKLQLFIVNGDLSMWVKKSQMGRKTLNKLKNKKKSFDVPFQTLSVKKNHEH